MGLKNLHLLLLLTIFLGIHSNILANDYTNTVIVDCNSDYISALSKKDVMQLTSEESFNLGLCSFQKRDFNKAYKFLLIAKGKGFGDEALVGRYIAKTEQALQSAKSIDVLPGEIHSADSAVKEKKKASNAATDKSKHDEIAMSQLVQLNFLTLALGFLSLVGLILALYLMSKASSDKVYISFMSVFILTISLVVIELLLFIHAGIDYAPKIPLYRILFFLWSPSLYLFAKNKFMVSKPKSIVKQLLVHYGIFVIVLISVLILVNFEGDITTNAFMEFLHFISANRYLKSAHLFFYVVLMVLLFRKENFRVSVEERKLLIALIIFHSIILITFLLRTYYNDLYPLSYVTKYFYSFVFSGFILVISVVTLIHPQFITHRSLVAEVEEEERHGKYRHSGLTPDLTQMLKALLIDALENRKLYLDSNLTLPMLAEKLGTDRYSLSQVINQEFNVNFYELINNYRIDHVVEYIDKNYHEIDSIIEVAYEAGFGNRVSFNKAFKKRLHVTPSKYLSGKVAAA